MTFNPLLPPPGALDRIRMSIIIPAFNEEKMIGKCLGSLTRLAAPHDSFEVILVDNGSNDRTIETARPFADQLNLTILQKTGIRISALRNLGASQARGQIFAFLDSDCIVPPTWLQKASALLAQSGVGIVGAHYRIPNDSRWVARAWYGGLESQKQGDLAWVPSGDLLMTRATFENVHGFDESIQTNEDCELCERVRAIGLRVVGDEALAVEHLGTPQTLWTFYRKIRWHATDGFRVFLRDLPKISNPRPLLFGLYTLVCLAGMMAGLVLAARHQGVDVLSVFLVALFLPSLLLSLQVANRQQKWRYLFPLTILYMVFGVARGQALLNVRSWR